ncbi:Uncharacterised protein [Mycobacteroides abscessus]|nr:Uncharacterised protein [Mycobacteroides abscessus]
MFLLGYFQVFPGGHERIDLGQGASNVFDAFRLVQHVFANESF